MISSLTWYSATGALRQIKGSVDVVAQHVDLNNVDVIGPLTIAGTSQAGEIELFAMTVTEELTLRGFGGDDFFRFRSIKGSKTLIDGGAGTDTYRDSGGNDLGDLTLLSIEKMETA